MWFPTLIMSIYGKYGVIVQWVLNLPWEQEGFILMSSVQLLFSPLIYSSLLLPMSSFLLLPFPVPPLPPFLLSLLKVLPPSTLIMFDSGWSRYAVMSILINTGKTRADVTHLCSCWGYLDSNQHTGKIEYSNHDSLQFVYYYNSYFRHGGYVFGSVCLFVCQDYRKPFGPIFMKLNIARKGICVAFMWCRE